MSRWEARDKLRLVHGMRVPGHAPDLKFRDMLIKRVCGRRICPSKSWDSLNFGLKKIKIFSGRDSSGTTPFFYDDSKSCAYFVVNLREVIGGEVVLGVPQGCGINYAAMLAPHKMRDKL
jgi:hypothetical protein